MKKFLERKGIKISAKRYFIDGMSAMTQGLFATLIIGLIIKTFAEQLVKLFGETVFFTNMIEVGSTAMGATLMGAAIGVAVCYGLGAPLLVIVSAAVTGSMGATYGGPAGAYVAALVTCEFGKAISKETKLDIILTPAVSLSFGFITAKLIGPLVQALMNGLGSIVSTAMAQQPFICGIVVSVVMGLVLTAPISSAALSLMLGLSGIAAGASTVGCSAQMIGFAVISYKDNGYGGFLAQGIGTSMLQVPNILKNPWIVVPPTLASAILGPVASVMLKMENNPAGAGMGTSGLVGQIGTLTVMGFTWSVFIKILILHILLPAVLSYVIYLPLKKMGKIKDGDMKLS